VIPRVTPKSPSPVGLYIHIPFCHARCGYCDFVTFAGQEDRIDDYVDELCEEVRLNSSHINISTVFFGGGTPSLLDEVQVTRILDDPSVSPLHARLQELDGEYILSDEKSVAGTWVNDELLAAPRRLQHGDVVYIGRLSYRFILRKPPERPLPKITPTRS